MIKFTKTELRSQQHRLTTLQKYLPTLQLKKMLLQMEVALAENQIEELARVQSKAHERIESFAFLFSDRAAFDLFPSLKILEVKKGTEHIAGLDLPSFERVEFQEADYFLYDAPVWLDEAIRSLRELIELREKIRVVEERKRLLSEELREVSIRVNLFDKILIPRAQENIKRIKIFLGDLELAAVCQAKVSKQKILKREEAL